MVASRKKLTSFALWAIFCGLLFWVGRMAPGWFSPGQSRPVVQEVTCQLRWVVRGALPGGPLSLSYFRVASDGRYEAPIQTKVPVPPSESAEWSESAKWDIEQSLPPGRYWMVGRGPGIARVSAPFELVDCDAPLARKIELTVASELTLEVKVRQEDESLAPLPKATVLVESAAPSGGGVRRLEVPFGALTDEAGRATFRELPEPPYRVRVYARGYEPYEAELMSDSLVVLRPVHVLRVKVTDSGAGVPGSIVEVSGLSTWPPRRVETQASGAVEILGLKAGRYALYGEHGERIGGPVMVEVPPGVGITEAEVQLGPGVMVGVLCQEENGSAVVGAHLAFQPGSPYDASRYGESDGEGRARLGPLRRAEGMLSVSAPGFVAQTVEVRDQTEVVVSLVRGGTVVGRVLDERGMPISGAVVRIGGRDEKGQSIVHGFDRGCARDSHFSWALAQSSLIVPAGELGVMMGPVPPIPLFGLRESGPCPTAASPQADSLVTDKDGRFAAFGVAPGTVVAVAEHENYISGRSVEGRLASEGSLELEIRLGEAQVLIGRVLDDRDFPVPDATVRVLGRGHVREARTERDGTFRVPAILEALTLRIFTRERPLVPALEERIPKERPSGELVFRLPKPREASELVLVDEEGHAVELAQVKLTSLIASEPTVETRFTDASGRVTVNGVRGLKARINVSRSGFAELEETRELGAEHRFVLERAVRVEGRVTSVRGRAPAPETRLTLRCGSESQAAVTNETGEYVFPAAPRGKCVLSAYHETLGSAELSAEIQKTYHGRAFVLPDLDLVAPEERTGRVTNAQGEPVRDAIVSAVPLPPYLPRDASLLPEPLTRTDERGEFRLSLSPGRTQTLYAVLPGQASGSGALSTRTEQPIEIVLSQEDLAPAELPATVLVGLEARQGRILLTAVLPKDRETQGLRVGDVLVEIDRETPRDLKDARALLSGAAGSEVRLLVERQGQTLDLTARREAYAR